MSNRGCCKLLGLATAQMLPINLVTYERHVHLAIGDTTSIRQGRDAQDLEISLKYAAIPKAKE